MSDPDESRPGGPATPPPADPAPAGADTGVGDAAPDPAAGAPSPYAAPASSPSASSPATADSSPAPPPVPPSDAPGFGTPSPAPTPTPAATSSPAPAFQPASAPPAPAATATPVPPSSPSSPSARADDDDDYDLDLDGYGGPRWISLVTSAGAAIIGVVALQVLMALVEAFSLKEGQRLGVGVADDVFHRIGYPFGSLGSTAMFFLLLATILLALPAILDEDVTDRQYSIGGAALRTAIVLAALVGLGSILAVRASMHEYSAKSVPVPGFITVQFVSFLLATLATSALAIFGALSALRLRDDS